MLTEEQLIEALIKRYEAITGWGDSKVWKNQDFIVLSEKVQLKTGEAISHVTLKRIWGRVKYDSLPNSHTLDTLVKYLDYENWREFRIKQSDSGLVAEAPLKLKLLKNEPIENNLAVAKTPWPKPLILSGTIAGLLAVLLVLGLWFSSVTTPKPALPKDYSFSSKKVVTTGVPNTVVFNYDARKSPYDSVVIQQSWDKRRRVTVSKNDHQFTSIYYYPEFYHAKLIVGGSIVKEHDLLIKSNGWVPMMVIDPVPVYFNLKDALVNGKLALSVAQIEARNIKLQPQTPSVLYSYSTDFGEIYTDDFVFETSVKNDYREGASVCQPSKLFILCENAAIWIPLCAKGCVSDVNLCFTDEVISGTHHDLTAFGVDFDQYVKVKIIAHNGKAQIFINNKLAYRVEGKITRSKIIGFDFKFQGTGSIDYVKLANDKVHYDEEF